MLKAEILAYHGEGTCTFFGTANSNQMLMEVMGLHIPGSAFVHPHSDLRHAYNIVATQWLFQYLEKEMILGLLVE